MEWDQIFVDEKLDYWQQLEKDSRMEEEKPKTFFLKNDIPFMVSDQGELVCLPRTKDPYVLACLGSRRCHPEGTKIMIDYEPREILSIYKNKKEYIGKSVFSYNFENNKRIKNKILDIVSNGKEECLRITTVRGRVIECTKNHIFLTRTLNGHNKLKPIEKLEAKELKLNTRLPLYSHKPIKETITRMSSERALGFLYGFYLSEGNCYFRTKNNKYKSKDGYVAFVTSFKELADKLKDSIEGLGYKANIKLRLDSPKGKKFLYRIRVNNLSFAREIKSIFNTGSKIKTLNLKYLIDRGLTKDLCYGLIDGLFSCDGTVIDNNKRIRIKYSSISEQLIDDIINLLSMFKIFCYKNSYERKETNWNTLYQLEVPNGHVSLFAKIGLTHNIKMRKITKHKGFKPVSNKREYLKQDIFWDKIKKIEKIGKKETYGLVVSGNHLYTITNGMVSHNTGKSLMLNGLLNRFYFYWNQACIWANDYQTETFEWEEPMENPQFVKMLENIGEKPQGLNGHLIHLIPGNIDYSLGNKRILKIGVTLKKFIERFDLFVGAAGGLDKSEGYFDLMKPELLKCKSPDEMERVIFGFDLGFKNQQSTKTKIWTRFYNALINEGIVDISNKELIAEIKIVDEDGAEQMKLNPLIAIAHYYGVPVIMTQEILTGKYFPGLYTSLIEDLFKSQRYLLTGRQRKPVNIFIDELRIVGGTRLNKEKKEFQRLVETLNQLVAQGGPANLSVFYGTQNPSEVPDVIFDNTKYVICTQLAKEEANHIANLFGLEKADFSKRVATLNKTSMECIAITNEQFSVYDPLNNKKWMMSGEIKGTYLPPLVNTLPPNY